MLSVIGGIALFASTDYFRYIAPLIEIEHYTKLML